MPTKKTKPTKKPRAKKSSTKEVKSRPAQSEGIILDTLNGLLGWVKHHILISLLAVVAIVALGWFGYTSLIKWQFSQAEKEVQNLSSAIIDKLGPPTSTDTLKSCSYKSEKYAYGQVDAACSVRIYLTYLTNSSDEALALAKKVTDKTRQLYVIEYEQQPNFTEISGSVEMDWSKNNYTYSNFSCTSWTSYNESSNVDGSHNTSVGISCGKHVKYYRIYPEV
ncbi:hypothetical protein KC871_04495 [Candidatus Saccharibacteria bacterium]|nr:hypothetical protein [Candidatus Saccharibacteria bacterium]